MKSFFNWKIVFIYTFIISVISFAPTGQTEPPFPFFDKIVHFMLYAGYSCLFLNTCFLKKIAKPYKISFICVLSFGIIIEIVQWFLPYRSFELADIIANAAGCALGLAFKIKHS
ncbi:MAG: VanZ family protein [Candidatus Omnitrophota bacterium]